MVCRLGLRDTLLLAQRYRKEKDNLIMWQRRLRRYIGQGVSVVSQLKEERKRDERGEREAWGGREGERMDIIFFIPCRILILLELLL